MFSHTTSICPVLDYMIPHQSQASIGKEKAIFIVYFQTRSLKFQESLTPKDLILIETIKSGFNNRTIKTNAIFSKNINQKKITLCSCEQWQNHLFETYNLEEIDNIKICKIVKKFAKNRIDILNYRIKQLSDSIISMKKNLDDAYDQVLKLEAKLALDIFELKVLTFE